MKRFFAFATLLLLLRPALAQNCTITGFITDASSGETLISAAVSDAVTAKGAVTNNFGFYSLTLPAGHVKPVYSYLGFDSASLEFDLRRDTLVNIALKPSTEFLKGAVVTATHSEVGVRGTQMSAIEVPVNQIQSVPALAGEVDVIKALQLLPGVQSGTEGSAGLYVRGGGPDENLLLLDGVPLYNVSHLFGFFSVFNADAVKNVTLYKGSFPARFGSRLSSVVDVRMKDGNDQQIHGSFSIGLLSAKFNLEGPIVKGKTTFNISARRTYFDVLSMPLQMYLNKRENTSPNYSTNVYGGYGFYDLNAKLTHKFSSSDKLYLSFYMGDDQVYVNVTDKSDYTYGYDIYDYTGRGTKYGLREVSEEKLKLGWDWGNLVTALRWNHVFGPKLFMNAAVNYTRYRHALSVGMDEMSKETLVPGGEVISDEDISVSMGYNSLVSDISAGADFEYTPDTRHDVKFGADITRHVFKPAISAMKMSANFEGEKASLDTTFGDKNLQSVEAALYAEDNFSITPWLKVNYGIHYSLYSVSANTYHSLEPRLSARLLATDNLSFKFSYSEMSQYVHLLSNTNVSLPMDLWVPVTDRIKPMRSRQGAAGVFYSLGQFDFSVEGYYKTMDNVLEYRDGATFLGSSTGWEEKVAMGRGWAYGVEFFVQKKVGKTTGWLGYTWSRSWRQFDREGHILNNGNPFPAKYDRIHDLSLTVSHAFNDRIDIAGTFVFGTGTTGSLAMENIIAPSSGGTEYSYYMSGTPYLSERNNFRMPNYHRADLGVNFHKQKKHGVRTFNISVYNVYNRRNPFLVRMGSEHETVYEPDGGVTYTSRKALMKVSIFPILPSISYSFKF